MPEPAVTVSDRYSDEDIASFYAAGFWRSDTLYDNLCQQAEKRPDQVLLFDSTRSLTYAALRDRGLRLAAGLRRLGVQKGDRVAVQIPNWADFGLLVVACNRLGAIMVPIMPIYRAEEVGYVLRHSGATLAITCEGVKGFDYLAMFEDLKADSPELTHLAVVRATEALDRSRAIPLEDLEVEGSPEQLAAEVGAGAGPDDGFLIIYTSGTTARPKGCFHTVNTLRATAFAIGASLEYSDADVQFGPSPISHATGLLTNFLLPLVYGASCHLMEAWEPVGGMQRIQQHRCTVAVSATAFLQMMIAAYDPEANDLSSMRFWVAAGSPVPGSVVERARTMLSGGRVLSLYGRTENFLTTMCTAEDPPERSVTSDGRALHGADVRIVDPEGNEVPRGQEGDIAYKGPSHMLEYYRDPEQTAALFTSSGHSRSGDLGRMDEDRYVRVTGRLKDIVIRGGMNISAREIEDLLSEHPSVGNVAVVGYPDERLGERVCAYVVASPGCETPTLDQLREFLREHKVATQKVPERLEVVDALPMTATGKVQKHILRDDVAKKVLA
ncbi:MAG: acyl-CoA synthetase [Thermoleophilaceae bacterium]|nr:acyl-CoA synthetase [Thermoleophilaceae bacterium]